MSGLKKFFVYPRFIKEFNYPSSCINFLLALLQGLNFIKECVVKFFRKINPGIFLPKPKHTEIRNRYLFWLNNFSKLGLNYLAEGLIIQGKQYDKPQEDFVEKWKKKGIIIEHEKNVRINGKKLSRMLVYFKDKNKRCSMSAFFQGQGVSICRNATIEGFIEQVIRGNKVIVAYDQANVGSSERYRHTSYKTFAEDLKQEASEIIKDFNKKKSEGFFKEECDVKLDFFGLCAGAIHAIVAASSINSDIINKVYATRSSYSYADMVALSPDYAWYFPYLGMAKGDFRAKNTKSKSKFKKFMDNIKKIIVHILNFSRKCPSLLRKMFWRFIFYWSGWNINIKKLANDLNEKDKLHVFTLNEKGKVKDDFLATDADLAYNLEKNSNISILDYVPVESYISKESQGDKKHCENDLKVSNKALTNDTNTSQDSDSEFYEKMWEKNKKFYDNRESFFKEMLFAKSQASCHHQAWSINLRVQKGGCGVDNEVTELDMVCR